MSTQSDDLRGRTAIVTGGGSGIGRDICTEIASAGANMLVIDVSADGAADTAAQLTETGVTALPIELDVTDSSAITAVRHTLTADDLMPDILVNNAGIFELAPLEDIDVAAWDRMIDVNLKGPFLMMQAFLPHMIDQQWGRVVSISSTAGKTGEAFASHYCAAKKGLIALGQGAALAAAPHVTVNCVCPGLVETPMTKYETRFWHDSNPDVSEEEVLDRMRQQVPMKRMGRPGDIARAVRWLSLPANDYFTGQAINVDGGLDFH